MTNHRHLSKNKLVNIDPDAFLNFKQLVTCKCVINSCDNTCYRITSANITSTYVVMDVIMLHYFMRS